MNNWKKTLSAAVAAGIITVAVSGCSDSGSDSVDAKRLLELTGDKNFKQVEQAWSIALVQERAEDQKIYAYWLKENGSKADPAFKFENFKESIMIKYNKQINQVKKHMDEIKKGVDEVVKAAEEKHIKPEYFITRKLLNEKKMASFQVSTSGYIRNTYYPFLQKQIKRLDDASDAVDFYDKKQLENEMSN